MILNEKICTGHISPHIQKEKIRNYFNQFDQFVSFNLGVKYDPSWEFPLGLICVDSTSLRSGINAHCGCKLRLILIMHQPHLGNPPQVISGVHLEKERKSMRDTCGL